MSLDRVKFYSAGDLGIGYQLSKAENILYSFSHEKNTHNINEIIEFYNISEYIDREIYLKSWTSEKVEEFKSITTKYKTLIGRWFNSICGDNFKDIFDVLDSDYTNDFLRYHRDVSIDT